VQLDGRVEGGLAAGHPVQGLDAVTRALQSSTGMSGRDLAVLAAWALGGLLLSVRFFRWDPSRPRHARSAGALNPARSA
jgi:hypothetical protein